MYSYVCCVRCSHRPIFILASYIAEMMACKICRYVCWKSLPGGKVCKSSLLAWFARIQPMFASFMPYQLWE